MCDCSHRADRRANWTSERRAAHAALSADECATAYLSPLTIMLMPGQSLQDVNTVAVQVAYCDVHGVDFAELYRGNDEAKAQRVADEHNQRATA